MWCIKRCVSSLCVKKLVSVPVPVTVNSVAALQRQQRASEMTSICRLWSINHAILFRHVVPPTRLALPLPPPPALPTAGRPAGRRASGWLDQLTDVPGRIRTGSPLLLCCYRCSRCCCCCCRRRWGEFSDNTARWWQRRHLNWCTFLPTEAKA